MISTLVNAVVITEIVFALTMAMAWILALRINFLSLVDAVWALGIGLAALSYAIIFSDQPDRRIFIIVLAMTWSLRLGGHLTSRLIRHFPVEDTRYQALRAHWQSGFFWKTFWFFQMQAVTQTLFVIPFLFISLNTNPFPDRTEVLGGLLALIGLIGEALADYQLKQFKADPLNQGKVCNMGLWYTSRHPNYFFEWLIWCGFATCALAVPLGPIAIVCPVVMLLLLLFVTGVRPSEIQSLKSKGDLYRQYQKTTSSFIPWFPKQN